MKKYIIGLVIMVVSLLFAGVIFADNNGVWHRAEDVRTGTFGQDEMDSTSDYIFVNPVDFNKPVQFNDEIRVNTIKSNDANGNVVIQLG